MSYIGATPLIGNYQKCDAITTSATDTFNLLVGGVAVSPATPQNCVVSLNGVIQAPTTAYTVSGSTIVFDSALTTSDVIDFIVILGNVLDLGTPSDDTVTAAKLNDTAISGQTALGAEPADTDEFLVSDAGTLKRVDYSYIKPGAADWVRLNTNTISSGVASFTVDNVFSSTYQIYKLFWSDVSYSTAVYPEIQFVTGGDGTVAAGSTYKWKAQFIYGSLTGSAVSDGTQSQTTGFRVTNAYDQNDSDYPSSGDITFFNPASDTMYNAIQSNVAIYESGQWRYIYGTGYYDGAKIAATGYKFNADTGTVDTGEFVLYGLKRA